MAQRRSIKQDVIKAEIEAATARAMSFVGRRTKSRTGQAECLIGRPSLRLGCADRLSSRQGNQPRAGSGARTIGKPMWRWPGRRAIPQLKPSLSPTSTIITDVSLGAKYVQRPGTEDTASLWPI